MTKMKEITQVAKKLNVQEKDLKLYGKYIAKVDNEKCQKAPEKKATKNSGKLGKLVLVTAMTSNKSGIGKTTVSIGLADALNRLNKSACLALREPSMGPVFGIKGGATGGGKSCIQPSDEINLHFTGDFHAVAQANNLLSSIIDNHIFFGNSLNIDTKSIFFKRCLDINDRSLREISYKIGDKEIKTGFNITAASEIMAIMCLSESIDDLKSRIGNILVALNTKGKPVFARDLKAEESVALLLKDALKPNLVQTLEGNPALVHFGPFANIAHGCNSIVATKFALSHADYCITEAGFGSDLGAEKFLNIKTRIMKRTPDAVVLVIVLNVIKEHGDGDILKGFENVKKHIDNLKNVFGLNLVVAINRHKEDDAKELELIKKMCEDEGVKAVFSEGFAKGGKGCETLAKEVVCLCEKPQKLKYVYELEDSIKSKIEKIAKKIYGAKKVEYSLLAEEKIKLANKFGFSKLFVNIAKTQFSFSDDKNLLGAPKDFVFHISDIEIRSGAGMIVAIAGNMLLMPGLGRNSNYLNMHLKENGEIEGIF